jgi:hypothetical protein
MSRQYNNIIKHLNSLYDINTTLDEYCKQDENIREFTYTCKLNGHKNILKTTSYINKRSLFTKNNIPLEDFCSICVKEKETNDNFEKYKEQLLNDKGHLLISYNLNTRDAEYICGNCYEHGSTQMPNLMNKNLGSCPKCQNNKFRLSYNKLKEDVENHGFKLLTKPEEYKSNKQQLDVICKCGYQYKTYLVSIRQDKHCKVNCKNEKSEKTCMEKYNERNVMHVDDNFYKCQDTYSTTKEYTFEETKRKINIQGTEDIIIKYILENENKLLKRKINEDEILQQNIPSFKYQYEGKEHKYYPDFYIKDTKLIIEAKTINTHNKSHHKFTNYLKYKSSVRNGYNIMIIILNDKKELFDIWYFLENGKEISILKENNVNIIFNEKLSNKMKLNNIYDLCNNFDLNKYL